MNMNILKDKNPISSTVKIVLVLSLVMWIISGTYVIKADEAGAVKRFGKMVPVSVTPGIHYHFPYPIDSVIRLPVTKVNSLAIGFNPEIDDELDLTTSEMSEFLTGDENIIHCQLTVQWSISDPIAYLSSSDDPVKLLNYLAQTIIMRELGKTSVDGALTKNRNSILNNVKTALDHQLNIMNIGIGIITVDLNRMMPPYSVAAAFKEVASAREEAASLIHDAEGYQNEAKPKSLGDAHKMLTDAKAHHNKVINMAQGDAQRFLLLLAEYRKSPALTRQRLWLETMERVYPKMSKYILGTKRAEKTSSITLFTDEQ